MEKFFACKIQMKPIKIFIVAIFCLAWSPFVSADTTSDNLFYYFNKMARPKIRQLSGIPDLKIIASSFKPKQCWIFNCYTAEFQLTNKSGRIYIGYSEFTCNENPVYELRTGELLYNLPSCALYKSRGPRYAHEEFEGGPIQSSNSLYISDSDGRILVDR
jgi:hypothetical protein